MKGVRFPMHDAYKGVAERRVRKFIMVLCQCIQFPDDVGPVHGGPVNSCDPAVML